MRYERFATTWKLIPVRKKLWKRDENLKNLIKIIVEIIEREGERSILEKAVFKLGKKNAELLRERGLGMSDMELVEVFLLLHGIETMRRGDRIIARNCLFQTTFELVDSELCSKLYEGFSSVIPVKIECSCRT